MTSHRATTRRSSRPGNPDLRQDLPEPRLAAQRVEAGVDSEVDHVGLAFGEGAFEPGHGGLDLAQGGVFEHQVVGRVVAAAVAALELALDRLAVEVLQAALAIGALDAFAVAGVELFGADPGFDRGRLVAEGELPSP